MNKISVVIVTYNSNDLIIGCIDSILNNNDINNDLEIIIVDNNSKHADEMFSSIKYRYGDRIKLIKNKNNNGYGQGNNIGIKEATSPVILVMNPDVRLISPIFKQALSFFSDSKLAMLGMKQMITKEKVGLSFTIRLNSLPILGILLTIICNRLQIYIPSLMYFSGACFFLNKDIFEKIGMFDENIFMYGEENDIHHRLFNSQQQYKLKYSAKMRYIHLVEDRPFSNKSFFQRMKSALYFCDKNNLNKINVINNKIIDEKFWILIEKIRKNENKKLNHELMLSHLKKIKSSLQQNPLSNF